MVPHGTRLIAMSLPFLAGLCGKEVLPAQQTAFGVKLPQRYAFSLELNKQK